jgi:salicylate hydroxylase
VGAGLTLTPNGLNSLAAIHPEIVSALKRSGSETQTINLKRRTGETILSQPVHLQQRFGQPMLNIRWSRLQEILASNLSSPILHLNHPCSGFEQTVEGVVVHFNGQPSIQADVLVGADGINSAVRQTLVGDGAPSYAGRLSWRAVIPFPFDSLPPDQATLMTAPNGQNCLLVDVGEGYLFWSLGALDSDGLLLNDAEAIKTRVLEVFADWAEPLPSIIKATPAELIVERRIGDRPPLNYWSQGRVTLLGDAAHPVVPSLGQGANMAFEDACELATCFAQTNSVESALHAYESSRIPRTEVIYTRSAMQGDQSYQPDSDTVLREVLEASRLNQTEFESWLYSYKPTQ